MYRLTEAFPYLLNRVGVQIGEMFSERLKDYKITLPMYRVMAALREGGDKRLGELRDLTSIELSTLSRLVSVMARKGLVSRKRPDGNARILEVNLTVRGRSLIKELVILAASYEEAGLRNFGAAEIARLKRDLITVYKNLADFRQDLQEAGSLPRRTKAR